MSVPFVPDTLILESGYSIDSGSEGDHATGLWKTVHETYWSSSSPFASIGESRQHGEALLQTGAASRAHRTRALFGGEQENLFRSREATAVQKLTS